MSRYIDADALKKDVARLHVLNDEAEIRRAYEYNPHVTSTDFEETLVSVFDAIDDAPTIEPKRGRWKIEVAETIYGKAYLLTCSECGETVSVTETALPYEHFCRSCGAEMKGDKE